MTVCEGWSFTYPGVFRFATVTEWNEAIRAVFAKLSHWSTIVCEQRDQIPIGVCVCLGGGGE